MRTLIIHHLESIWDSGYRRSGETFDSLCQKFAEYLEENRFDRVILTRFEDARLEPQHYEYGLDVYINDIHDYGYGWEKEELEDYPDDFCEGGSHSGAVYLADWMRDLRGEVFISGAFDGECVEDLEIALTHLAVPFQRIEELIL